ncbi:hypothetical protein MGA3_15036 [Bacillus methanolicus MGA3]|nr:hypothetical protein MGA3_15036 [Bacillus methanolicus MGA3]
MQLSELQSWIAETYEKRGWRELALYSYRLSDGGSW